MNVELLLNKNETQIEEYILNQKDPHIIIHLSTINNKWISNCIDPYGHIWYNLINKHYQQYSNSITKHTSYKDFYVLLYYIDTLKLFQFKYITTRAQSLVNLLPKIYLNDHAIILNGLASTSIIANISNIVMFRNKDNILNLRFLDTNKDLFTSSFDISNYNKHYNINSITGAYLP